MKKKYYLFKYNLTVLYGFTFVLTLIVFAIIYYVYKNIYDINSLIAISDSLDLVMILLVPYLILHEILHGVGYVLHGADYKKIIFGAQLEKGLLFCLCKQNVTKKNALLSLIYPFFFIGIVTLIIGFIINSPVLVMLSTINILGCGGDIVAFYNLSKLKNYEFSESDDLLTFGLYTNEDLSKKKFFGLTYVDTVNEIERKNLKKINISKTTILILIIYYTAIALDLLY